MEELLAKLLESAKTDKKGLRYLKDAAVRCGHFELAAKLREMETTLFPESKEVKEAKEIAEKLNLLFRMIDVGVPLDVCWSINEAFKQYNKKKDKFSVKEAAEIIAKRKQLFDE